MCGLRKPEEDFGRLSARAQERKARTAAVNVMQGFAKGLPLYVWLLALPQLTSRVCHPHAETQKITQHILTRVTANFPHQVQGGRSCSFSQCCAACSELFEACAV
jgi:hypothetical protein